MEDKKGGDLICKRPQIIVEARFKLTKKQNDILDMVFATIEDDGKLQYEIDISKYSKLYNIQNQSHIYEDLKKTVKTFEGKGFTITEKISEKKENRMYCSWFSMIKYNDGEGKITVELGQTLKQLLLEAKQAIYYNIEYSLNFSCIYSKRIYYYLKLYEDTGWRIDNLDELRTKLECPKTYERYADFKRYVLSPAYEEINGNSDISFEYEEIKVKGKVTSLKFHIKHNNQTQKEISATKTDHNLLAPKEEISEDEAFGVKRVKAIMCEHDISDLEALKILKSSMGDFAVIQQVYDNFKNKQLDTLVGTMISMVKPNAYIPPKRNYKKDDFNSFTQRTYNYSDLEKNLLNANCVEDTENSIDELKKYNQEKQQRS